MSDGPPTPTLPLAGVLARWDAVVIRWGLDGDERTELLGGFRAGPVADVASYGSTEVERRIRLLVELEPVLSAFLTEEDDVRAWLRRANPALSGRVPIDVMARSPEWIRWLIDALGIGT